VLTTRSSLLFLFIHSFIPKFFKGCVALFKSGGDQEPEVIEQVSNVI
jgi:hypothetical protein